MLAACRNPYALYDYGLPREPGGAAKIALDETLDFLVSAKRLSRSEAYILASDAANLHITHLVDGKKCLHALLPKAIFVK